MSNMDNIKLLINSIAGQENYFSVNKVFVELMESLEGGIFLSQLIYWSDRSNREDGYFYKTFEEWKNEIYVSEHHIRKHTKKLIEMGVLETKVKKANGNPTLHYKVDMEYLANVLVSFLKILRNEDENLKNGNLNNSETILKKLSNVDEKIQIGNQNISDSLTEITTKTTTKNTTENKKESRKPVYDESSVHYQLANLLFEKILQDDPSFKKPNLQEWANHIRLMMERDERTEEQIRYLIEWSQNNSFWNSHILSTKKLREKATTLIKQIKAENEKAAKPQVNHRGRKEVVPEWFNERNNKSDESVQVDENKKREYEERRRKMLESIGTEVEEND